MGSPADRHHRGLGRGTTGDDIRDATGRVPILWFQDTDEHETPRQRCHATSGCPEVAEQRISAAVAAGGVVVDDSQAPSHTVLADPGGNKACVCAMLPAPQDGDSALT